MSLNSHNILSSPAAGPASISEAFCYLRRLGAHRLFYMLNVLLLPLLPARRPVLLVACCDIENQAWVNFVLPKSGPFLSFSHYQDPNQLSTLSLSVLYKVSQTAEGFARKDTVTLRRQRPSIAAGSRLF